MPDDHRDPETYAIIGAAMEVHRCLGPGFLEPVYQDALAIEFTSREIRYCREVELSICYKNTVLRPRYRPDFVCLDSIVVELKALRTLSTVDDAQVINYLKASGLGRGLLFNFGSWALVYRRSAHRCHPLERDPNHGKQHLLHHVRIACLALPSAQSA